MTADTGGSATAFSVSYTVTADDVSSATAGAKGTAVAKGLADALRNDATVGATFLGGAAATTVTAVTVSATGVVRIDDTQGYGLSNMTLVASGIANALGSAGTTYAAIKLDSVNNSPIKIDLGQNTSTANHLANHGLLEANVGAADFDVNDPTLSAAGGTSMSGLTITSATSASAALKTLDNAIDSVSAIRGDLGAVQNRLSYTTNNLSSIVTNTEGAKGRIMDADFAMETSKLAKTQILSQAATSMLAQANQSKQSLLALLQ
jgi:flagellin